MNVLVLIPYLYDTVPGQRFRIEQWARILGPQGVRFHFVPFESPELKAVLHTPQHPLQKMKELTRCIRRRLKDLSGLHRQKRWDVIFLYRELLPMGPPWCERALARTGIPLVYDFDDAIYLMDISEVNRRFKWLKWPQKVGEICSLSTHVTVGNRYLKEFVARHTSRVSVVPTSIDTDAYLPKADVEIRGKPVIGWSGSLTTLKHLRTIEPALKILRRSLDFRLKVVGSADFSIPGLDVESKPWSTQSEIEDLKSFDIGIMPLPSDAWAVGKCGLKALQYMAVGVPTIASPVGVNSEIIQNEKNGFIASTVEEWVDKILRLVSDKELRRRFSQEGRQTVEERYGAKVQAPRLLEIFEQVRRPAGSLRKAVPSASVHERHDILCFSSIDWDFVWQGHQEIMTTLARQGHRVLFVENTGVRNPQWRDIPRIQRRLMNRHRSLQGFQKIEENLYLFSPLVLPFPYWRLAQWINRLWVVSALRRWMRAMEFDRPVCWTFLPTPLTLEVIRKIPTKVLIYYCIDNFAESTPAARRILKSEAALLRKADLVFVTSNQLFEYASRWNRQVHLFPFGVSFESFERARSVSNGAPGELQALRRPIVGYVGGIHQWVDQELLCRAAQACKDYSFVLVGPIQTQVEQLKQEPNVFLLGQKPHDQLPHYIRHFDVGIIPYRLTEYTKNVYPTKLNEYHAMGKPVVSTPLPEILTFNQRHQDLVKIGVDEGQFCSQIERALKEDTQLLQESRVAAARENAWSHRIQAMQGLIQEVILRKASAPREDWTLRFAASLRSSRRLLSWMVASALLIGIVFQTPLVWFLSKPLIVSGQAQPADVIVVFAGGVGESGQAGEGYQERVKQAAELFEQGYAPRILLVSGYTWTFQEADIMDALARALGVPGEIILKEKQVHRTYDYVLKVKELAAQYRWKSILLVTSPYHSRRAALTFSRNAPQLLVIQTPVLESSYYAHGRGITPRQLRGILQEALGIVAYWLKGWI